MVHVFRIMLHNGIPLLVSKGVLIREATFPFLFFLPVYGAHLIQERFPL